MPSLYPILNLDESDSEYKSNLLESALSTPGGGYGFIFNADSNRFDLY